jgi:type IX secretion system PorP/SprF family membrane protein
LIKCYLKILIFSCFISNVSAQQFPQYTQFIFNKIGYNPAASGTSVNAPYELIFGARTQWIGVSNNPKSGFASFNYNFVPKHAYSKWHNVGIYIDQDQNGNFVHNDVWLSYTFHLLLSKKLLLSSGVFAGIKQYRITKNNLDRNDPAVSGSANSTIALPDISPGVRLSNKKFFIDFALQQITVFSQRGIGGKIGSPSRVIPHYIFSIGKKGKWNDFNTLMLAMNFHGSVSGLPSTELNIMNYYNKRFAFGFSVRGKNFISGIIQFRMFGSVNVGLAYDLSINKMFRGSPNTGEIMVSFSPVFGGELVEKTKLGRPVDECSF